MTAVGIASLLLVRNSTHKVLDTIIPHEKITKQINQDLRLLNKDISEMLKASNQAGVSDKIKLLAGRLNGIKAALNALHYGGVVSEGNGEGATRYQRVSA